MTSYLVLQKTEDGCWKPVATVEAHNHESASRSVAESEAARPGGDKDSGGEYVAVPSRSFVPVEVVIERTLRAIVSAKVST